MDWNHGTGAGTDQKLARNWFIHPYYGKSKLIKQSDIEFIKKELKIGWHHNILHVVGDIILLLLFSFDKPGNYIHVYEEIVLFNYGGRVPKIRVENWTINESTTPFREY